jgi:Ca2+/Na+ antiporter
MLVFTALSLSADVFFAPAVSNIAEWLRLSDDVAGATLLAFGNGAPDFFTQVAAITHGKSVDLPLALGEGVGAGMYVSCFCLAVSVLCAPAGVPVPPGPFIRDVVAYLGGFLIIIAAAMDRTINTAVRENIVHMHGTSACTPRCAHTHKTRRARARFHRRVWRSSRGTCCTCA